MGVSYFILLSFLGLATTVQAQVCNKPTGGSNMNLKDSDILRDTFPEGIKVTFVCVIGYQSAGGSGSSTCTAGSWTPVRLKCERFMCGSGGDVPNGNIDYPTGNQYTDVMVITCNTGYTLVGASEISCGSQGWTKRLPTCLVVSCDPPEKIENGAFNPDSETEYGHVVQFTCDPEYTLIGSKSISCSETGKLTPDPPKCIKVNCLEFEITNAVWIKGARPPYGHRDSVTYQCNPGYEMIGEATRTCEATGQWSPEPSTSTCKQIVPTTKPTTTTTTTTATTTTATTTTTKKDPHHTVSSPSPPPPHSHKVVGIVFGALGTAFLTKRLQKKKRE